MEAKRYSVMNYINRIILGIKRHGWKSLVFVYCAFAVIWTIIEPLWDFLPDTKFGFLRYFGMVLLALIGGGWKVMAPKKVTIRLKNTNTSIEILFGDIFAKDGHKVIPVNEYFDSEIGDLVSPTSLHGIFIQNVLGGQSQIFDELVDKGLSGIDYELTERKQGRQKKFPIGTTLVDNSRNPKYFLVALSRTDIETLKAKADVPELWQALSSLWNKVRIEAGGNLVNLPLIGSGLSGVGLPAQQLLQIIIISILNETKKTEITKKIRIVLLEDVFEDVNLDSLKKDWR